MGIRNRHKFLLDYLLTEIDNQPKFNSQKVPKALPWLDLKYQFEGLILTEAMLANKKGSQIFGPINNSLVRIKMQVFSL